MSDWKRTTHEVAFDRFPPETKAIFQKHIELYNLGDILSDMLMCVQNDAEKTKKGMFGSAETNRTCVILTPQWLVWVVSGTKTPPTALSALLRDVLIQDYSATPFAKMVPDSGIQVNGKFTDMAENASAFIGLENNPAGDKFKELAIRTVRNAKK